VRPQSARRRRAILAAGAWLHDSQRCYSALAAYSALGGARGVAQPSDVTMPFRTLLASAGRRLLRTRSVPVAAALGVAGVVAFAGYAGAQRPGATPGLGADTGVAARRAAVRALDITDDTIPDPELDQVARAAGLRPLRAGVRRPRSPEIRLAMHVGIGVPDDLLVLRRRGDRTSGEVWLWWGPDGADQVAEDGAGWQRHAGEFGCPAARWVWDAAPGRAGDRMATLTCRATLRPAPDWRRLWRRLDSLGVWTLPDADELPRPAWLTLDGVTLTVETFDGARYRRVEHANPDGRTSPEAARAAAILGEVQAVLRAVRYRRAAGR